MYERHTTWLRSAGINTDAREFLANAGETTNPIEQLLANALDEVVTAERRLRREAERLHKDMARLLKRLDENHTPSVNPLGEAQNRNAVNVASADLASAAAHFAAIAEAYKAQRTA